MNIKEKFNNAKAWTAEKAGQAKEWCKDHSVEIWSAIATGTACFGCYLTGRIVERQETISEMLEVKDQAVTYKQKYESQIDLINTAYNAGLREGRLEGKIEGITVDVVLDAASKDK